MFGLVPFNRKNKNWLDTGFEDFYNTMDDFFSDSKLAKSGLANNFKLDVQESESEYIIDAELPGIDKDDVSVELKDEMLTISVKKEESVEEEKKNYIHKERRSSSMQRSMYLAGAKSEDVKAKLKDGVLNIVVPKDKVIEDKTKIEIE